MLIILLSFVYLCSSELTLHFNDTLFTIWYDTETCETQSDDKCFKIVKIHNGFLNVEDKNICILTGIVLFPFILLLLIWSIWCCCDCDKRCCKCCKRNKRRVMKLDMSQINSEL